jgi:hypothetical protein
MQVDIISIISNWQTPVRKEKDTLSTTMDIRFDG